MRTINTLILGLTLTVFINANTYNKHSTAFLRGQLIKTEVKPNTRIDVKITKNSKSEVYTGYTNEQGIFTVDNVSSCMNCQLSVQSEGFNNYEIPKFDVYEGETILLNVKLNPVQLTSK